MTATICFTILTLALLVALLYMHRANGRERQALLDRIEAPIHSRAAAAERVLPPPPDKPAEPVVYAPNNDPDLALLALDE